MKTREREPTKKGLYQATFSGLIRKSGVVSLSQSKKADSPPRALLRLKSGKVEIPISFPVGKDWRSKAASVCGAIGVPLTDKVWRALCSESTTDIQKALFSYFQVIDIWPCHALVVLYLLVFC